MDIIIEESKRKQALSACKNVINGIEDGTISVLSALLQCKKIARLLDDIDGITWLSYEYGGYPQEKDGLIESSAFLIATEHGRGFIDKDSNGTIHDYIFIELCSELEESIDSYKRAINNYTTQGLSVSGEYTNIAIHNFTNTITNRTNQLLSDIRNAERRLSILKAQYYDYAVRWHIELVFGNTAKSIFEEYQEVIDRYYSLLPTVTIQKLNAIESLMEDENPERYAQVLTSCRRLWADIAEQLFLEVLPGFPRTRFKTKSGKEIDITGEHYNNKLSAVIEALQSKSTINTIVGSETVYLIDWLEKINKSQSSGVHSEVSRTEARQCIIHTYIALGDILNLKNNVCES